MDRGPDFPVNFADLKCQRVDAPTFDEEPAAVKHLLTEPKNDNVSVNGRLHSGEQNSGGGFKVEDIPHGFEFGSAPNYGGWESYNSLEGGVKFEILDRFLDEVDEVDDIYAAQDLSTACDHFFLDFELTEKISEWDCGLRQVPNSGSETHSLRPSGSSKGATGLAESSKQTVSESECKNETVPETESKNKSLHKEVICNQYSIPRSNCRYQEPVMDNVGSASNAVQNFDELDDGEKPIASYIVSGKEEHNYFRETEAGTHVNRKRLPMATHRLEATSQASYDFRPRRGRPEKCPLKADHQSEQELTASEFEDDSPITKKSRSRFDRRKRQRMWTLTEVVALVDGISEFGVGKWTDIKRLLFPSAAYRTPIDLRDKWRNLLRATYSHKERQKHNCREADGKSRHAMRPLPKQIMHRIRELAALHPYPISKSLVRRTSRKKNQI